VLGKDFNESGYFQMSDSIESNVSIRESDYEIMMWGKKWERFSKERPFFVHLSSDWEWKVCI